MKDRERSIAPFAALASAGALVDDAAAVAMLPLQGRSTVRRRVHLSACWSDDGSSFRSMILGVNCFGGPSAFTYRLEHTVACDDHRHENPSLPSCQEAEEEYERILAGQYCGRIACSTCHRRGLVPVADLEHWRRYERRLDQFGMQRLHDFEALAST